MEKFLYFKKKNLPRHQMMILDDLIRGGGVKIVTRVYIIYKIMNPLTLFRFNKTYLSLRFKEIEE